MDKEAVRRAAERLQIQDIYFRDALVKMDGGFDPTIIGPDESGPPEIATQFRIGATQSAVDHLASGQKRLRVFVQGGVRFLKKPGSDEEPHEQLAVIEATIVAVYLFTGEGEPEKADIDEFAQHNVVYNVWPYFREYVHSTAMRHRLPPVVVPLFRWLTPEQEPE